MDWEERKEEKVRARLDQGGGNGEEWSGEDRCERWSGLAAVSEGNWQVMYGGMLPNGLPGEVVS